jgi:hypothetical protein
MAALQAGSAAAGQRAVAAVAVIALGCMPLPCGSGGTLGFW